MPQHHRARRAVLCSMVAVALAAITCRSYAYFSLDHEGLVTPSAAAQGTALPLEGLANIDVSRHPLMASQGLTVNDITYAAIKAVTLAVDRPTTGQDLSFVGRVDVVLLADNMAPLTIASGGPFEAGQNLGKLEVTQDLVTGYLKGTKATVTLVPTFAGAVPDGITLGVNMVTQVRVGEPGGSCQN